MRFAKSEPVATATELIEVARQDGEFSQLALHTLERHYNLTITVDGRVISTALFTRGQEIDEQALRAQEFGESTEGSEDEESERLRQVAQGLVKAKDSVLYHVVDVPAEALKSRKHNARLNHARRLVQVSERKEARRQAREARKAEREAAKEAEGNGGVTEVTI